MNPETQEQLSLIFVGIPYYLGIEVLAYKMTVARQEHSMSTAFSG